MDDSQLIGLRDRLAARLVDDALTRYQLIDIATVLMFVHWDVRQAPVAQPSPGVEPVAIDVLGTTLCWIREHADEAPIVELRARIAAAVDAVAHIGGYTSVHPSRHTSPLSPQERAHA